MGLIGTEHSSAARGFPQLAPLSADRQEEHDAYEVRGLDKLGVDDS